MTLLKERHNPTENENNLLERLKKRRNQYESLKAALFFRVLRKGKVSFRKLFNVFLCSAAYFLKSDKSAPSPFILSLELWNECNAGCLFCRDKKGRIYDVNPQGNGIIEKGMMPLAMAADIIRQFKDDLLIAVLYTNGEPLLYPDLAKVVQAATENRVATMMATNGLLWTEEKARAVLSAGIDFIKIQLSGYTQDIYSVQIRYGDVEKLKNNIRMLARVNEDEGYKTVIMIDYILYNYNRHQLDLVKEFCKDLGVMLNIRPGNPKGGLEEKEPPLHPQPLPLNISCDWLWKGMQVNWNGDVLQCCDGVVWSKSVPYATFRSGAVNARDVWNGPMAQKTRAVMRTKGRGGNSMCSQCTRTGVAFKW